MTTENSRADALTDEQRIGLEKAMAWCPHGSSEANTIRELLAASPVEQPAAAPIDDEQRIEAMARAMNVATDGHDRYWTGYVRSATAALRALRKLHPAPSPADARVGLTAEQRASITWAISAAVERGYTADADVLRALLATPQPEPRAEVTHGDTTMDECMASLLDRLEAAELYADRYRYLRERPLDVVSAGGVFAGKTPDNVVLNGADLDAAVDAARTGASS